MVTGFNHSGFVVRDMDKMVSFYRDDLGLVVVREVESIAPPEGNHTGIPGVKRSLTFVGVPDGEHVLELVQFIDPPSPEEEKRAMNYELGAAHVCFNVSDLETLHKDLSEKGIQFITEPKFTPTEDGGRRGIVYCRDPEGNFLEFIQPG